MANNGSFSTSINNGYNTLKIDWSVTQSVSNNSSVITANIYEINQYALYIGTRTGTITINGKDYSFTSPTINSTGTHLLGTVTSSEIAHNSNGAKSVAIKCVFNIQATISGSYYSSITASDTVILPTIPRTSTMTAQGGTLGSALIISVEKASSSFSHTIRYSCGSSSGTIVTKSQNATVRWTPPLGLASQNTSGTSVSIKLYLQTYDGSGSNATPIGDEVSLTISAVIPESVKPGLVVNISDPTGNYERFETYIQNKSKLNVVLSITTAYGSPISSYSIKVGSQKVTANGGTFDLPKAGNIAITITIKDKRGRSATESRTVYVTSYQDPAITDFSVLRCNASGDIQSDGEYFRAFFSSSVTDINGKNTASYFLCYKEKTSSEWTNIQMLDFEGEFLLSDVGSSIQPALIDNAYDVQIKVTDSIQTKKSMIKTIGVAFVLIQTTPDGTGIAFGQRATENNTATFGIPLKMGNTELHKQLLNSLGHYHISSFKGQKKITLNQVAVTLLIMVGATSTAAKTGMWYVASGTTGAYIYPIKESSIMTLTSDGLEITVNNSDSTGRTLDILCIGAPNPDIITIT